MTGVRVGTLDETRSLIARGVLDEHVSIPPRLGRVTLREHQRVAAARLASLIAANNGAMLAEPVGLGKTYTALAAAAAVNTSLLIAVPAALRTMWQSALTECEMQATVITHEALSRRIAPALDYGFVIVDEAHRLRSPSTHRYATLAEVCRRAKVLLVTATPVQNRRADLATQLALFLGRAAWELSDEELARHVVRDSATEQRGQPRLAGPYRVSLPFNDEDCLDALVALPAPVPAKDEVLAFALLTYGLVHQWTSSRAALIAALDRRRARGIALIAALDAGRRPTRAELTAWTHGEGAVQLAFPELVTVDAPIDDANPAGLMDALSRHDAAILTLLTRLRVGHNPDIDRAEALLRVRAEHSGERVIAFCHYTETVHALRSLLARERGVAALTAHGARIAGGRISREDVIAQFAPSREASAAIDPTQRIDLLITTDLLSEGLNLQEASVIVHLDLPWNPARLDQRVGRARRLGSRHDSVTVYTFGPPARAERMLQIETRLRDKLTIAQHTVGIAGRILPSSLGAEPEGSGLAERIGAVKAELRRWIGPKSDLKCAESRDTLVAAVASATRGFLALIRDAEGARLVADVGSGIDHGPASIDCAVRACRGPEGRIDVRRLETVTNQLDAWLAGRVAIATIDFQAASAARFRRAALRRVAQALARAPRHQRSRLAPLAAAARAVATSPMAEGAERILELLVDSQLSDEAWLRSVATFGELNARPRATVATVPQRDRTPTIIAIVLLEPGPRQSS